MPFCQPKKVFMNINVRPLALIFLFSLAWTSVYANTTPPDNNPTAKAIETIIASQHNDLLSKPDFSSQAQQISNLYRINDNQLLWLGRNRSASTIETTLTLLRQADADGLNPNDYDAATLSQYFRVASTLSEQATSELAKFDTALSISLLRFINDLHGGRANPQQFDYPNEFGTQKNLDTVLLIKQSIDRQMLKQIPETAAPHFEQYRKLKKALSQYRNQPQESHFQPLVFEKALRPGDPHPQLAELRQRLIDLGVLGKSTEMPPDMHYSETLMEAIKEFQRSNGLQADGIIGSQTAALLNQSVDQKIRQIELAMERLRWLPENLNGPLIIVNIPAYQLWAFDTVDAPESLNMKVIVGKASKNQTPVLLEEMKYVEFMPYWNIPSNIMNEEILPKLYNDWGYLESQDIELVQLYKENASSWDSIFDDIANGRVRARQRPGKKNPLGKVKFIFPNKSDVYLHDTSTPGLFSRSRRDFSHGCVRVEQAERLAEFVLGHQPNSEWDLERIQEAMAGPNTRRVPLKKAIQVLFFYTTVFIDHDDRIHFYPDIYNQNAALEDALGKLPFLENNGVKLSDSR